MFSGKPMLVVGGGDAACDEAGFLSKLTDRVILVHRRDRFRAQGSLAQRVLNNPSIEVRFNTEVDEILGSSNEYGIEAVSSVRLRNNVTGEVTTENVAAVFVFVGSTPQTELVPVRRKG
jgi:thioredoxin reductase (NADPH)